MGFTLQAVRGGASPSPSSLHPQGLTAPIAGVRPPAALHLCSEPQRGDTAQAAAGTGPGGCSLSPYSLSNLLLFFPLCTNPLCKRDLGTSVSLASLGIKPSFFLRFSLPITGSGEGGELLGTSPKQGLAPYSHSSLQTLFCRAAPPAPLQRCCDSFPIETSPALLLARACTARAQAAMGLLASVLDTCASFSARRSL